MEIAARQYNPNPLTFGPRRTLAGWGERLCLSPLPNGECQSLGGVQGALFKGLPLLLEERKTCSQVAFLMAMLSKVLLRYSWQE